MSEIRSNSEVIVEFIQTHPDVGLRMRTIIDVMNNANGDMILIDDVDERMVEELQKLGNVSMETWAEEREKTTEQKARGDSTLKFERKKKLRATRDLAAR